MLLTLQKNIFIFRIHHQHSNVIRRRRFIFKATDVQLLAIFVISLENCRGYILRWHVSFSERGRGRGREERISFYNFFNENHNGSSGGTCIASSSLLSSLPSPPSRQSRRKGLNTYGENNATLLFLYGQLVITPRNLACQKIGERDGRQRTRICARRHGRRVTAL